MTDVAALLTVQDHDTALTQLAYKVSHLPERQSLKDVESALAALEADAAAVQAQLADLHRRQRAVEDEAAGVTAKAADAEKKLYSGSVTSPRELQALQADIAALKRHQSELDDRQLELMIEREPFDDAAAGHVRQRGELDGAASKLRVAIAEAESEIEREAASHRAAREAAAAAVPAPLLTLYERLRASAANGIAAARLVNGTCTACRLKLSAVDLDRIRREPADAMVRCEACGAILVR
jgi:predicted  nucleic acid-binding Zn-ribbon protein